MNTNEAYYFEPILDECCSGDCGPDCSCDEEDEECGNCCPSCLCEEEDLQELEIERDAGVLHVEDPEACEDCEADPDDCEECSNFLFFGVPVEESACDGDVLYCSGISNCLADDQIATLSKKIASDLEEMVFGPYPAPIRKALVWMVPGGTVPTVFDFNGANVEAAFESMYNDILADDDFVVENLPLALQELARKADDGGIVDIENFVYAMCYRYSFYVVPVVE